ncbi:MAG: hypothetical protein ACK4WF_08325 [Candidatus Brocadiales bacterium]
MKRLALCVMLMFFLIGAREVIGGGCCQEGASGSAISLEAVLEEVRTTFFFTDAQLNTLKSILEKHGIKTGAHVCPMTEKGEKAGGGCCAAKKEMNLEVKPLP